MPHIRDPVTHRCVVCQRGRHPSPFPIGWRCGGMPHKCHQWERFERRRRAEARDHFRRQIGSTTYMGPEVLEFGPPQVNYLSLDYDENFVPVGDDRTEGQQQQQQQQETPRRRRGGLRQSEQGTASLDQYHFFNDPLISKAKRGYAVRAVSYSPEDEIANPQYLQGDTNGENRSVKFSDPPAIAVVTVGDNDNANYDDVIENRGTDDGLNARFKRRQTRGAFSREEFGRAVEGQSGGGRTRSQSLAQQQLQQKQPASLRHQEAAASTRKTPQRETDAGASTSSTCEIL